MKRERITINASYYVAARELPDGERLALYDAIMRLAFEGREPRLATSALRVAWAGIARDLHRSIARSDNGQKGGAPRGNQNARRRENKQNADFENNLGADFEKSANSQSAENENVKSQKNKQKTSKKQAKNKLNSNKSGEINDTPARGDNDIIINNIFIPAKNDAAQAQQASEKPETHKIGGSIIFDNTGLNNNNIYNNNYYDEIIKIYNSICAREKKLPKLLRLSERRKQKLACRLREMETLDDFGATALDVFRVLCERIAASSFLTGNNDRRWTASFDWIIENETNFIKVLEGRYDNAPAGTQTTNYGSKHLNERAAEQDFWRQQHDIARAAVAGEGGGYMPTIPDDREI